jgi:23S rRNA pseudouridine1911/1915/1917 synthase
MPAAERRRQAPLRAETRELANARLVIVPPFAAGDRLDGFLQRHGGEPKRSRSEWQRLIGVEAVLVNGYVSKPSERVATGDRVSIALSATTRPSSTPPPEHEVPFRVVFEDPAMIVVDKPAGLVVHPAPGNEHGTLVNGLVARFPELGSRDADLRPGIVHRLDKDTSGLLVIGRTVSAVAELQRQMQSRQTEKRYWLLMRGGTNEDEGVIDRPIGRDPRNRQRMAIRSEGRSAQTHFWVRERFSGWTLVEALLLTGRTHQLRVHFASIGHPVAGDTTYGRGAALPGLHRQFLHAYLLRLRSPHDGQERRFESELPPELESILSRLRGHAPAELA